MAEQVFLFRKAVEFGEQTLRELRGRGLEDEEIGLVRLYLKYKGIGFRYENWELGFAYYMKYTRDAYSGDGELKFVLEDESDVPDWQRRHTRPFDPSGQDLLLVVLGQILIL